MDRKKPFERLLKIDYLLQLRKPYSVNKKELMRRCGASERTIKGDIAYMRDVMDAPIRYNRRENGYQYVESFNITNQLAIPEKEYQQIKMGLEIIKHIEDNDILKNIFKIYSKIESQIQNPYSKYIYFEKVPYFQGTELISFFLEAIINKKVVQLTYRAYKTDTSVKRVFHPYFLKEHNNRWFVIGHLPQFNAKVTYALDRIKKGSLSLNDDCFELPKDFNVETFFEYTYGITVHSNDKIEEVLLSFSPLQAQYFKSKPFHRYETVRENANELVVKMLLKPNYELIRKLAGMGNGVKILKPASLINQLIKYHKKALNQYV